MNYSRSVPAAVRTLRILELLATEPEGLTAGNLGAALDIPHSALHALLNTLKAHHYISQTSPRQPYCLGPRMHALNRPRPLGTSALLFAFYEETARSAPEETFALAVLNGPDVLVLAEAACTHTVRSVIPTGHREPADQHPAGLVLLAGLSEPMLIRLLHTPSADLITELHTTRQQTMAQRHVKDVITLAVPICPDGQRPEAALIASIPAFRWDEAKRKRLTRALRETAARISHRLGAQTYLPYGTAQPHHLGTSVAMPEDELYTFLNGPWAARLACIRPDGSPHIVTVWYEWDGESFLITAWPGSSWADFIIQNPSVALTIAEPWPPMRRVLVRGKAQHIRSDTISGGLEGLYRRLSTRYLGTTTSTTQPVSYATGWQAFRILGDKMIAQREKSLIP